MQSGEDPSFRFFRACMNLEKTAQLPCDANDLMETKIEFDSQNRQLTITKSSFEDFGQWGFAGLSKENSQDGSFNELNLQKLADSKIVIKLAHGNLDDFEFVTGNILLKTNDTVWHEGSFSLLP